MIPLTDGTDWWPNDAAIKSFQEAYPGIDVRAELKKAAAWALANKTKRWTSKGVMRGVNAWLSKAQNDSVRRPNQNEPRRPGYMTDDEYRHAWALDRIIDAKIQGIAIDLEGDYRLNLWSLADQAIERCKACGMETTSAYHGTAYVMLRRAWR